MRKKRSIRQKSTDSYVYSEGIPQSSSKLFLMLHKEVKILTHIFKFGPLLHRNWFRIQIVNPGVFRCQDKGRMGGNDKLTIKKSG